MPIYSFKDQGTGEIVEKFFHMKDAPPIGEPISDRLVRIPDLPIAAVVADRHFVSRQQPRWYTHHKNAGGAFNKIGQPVYDSMEQVQQTASRSRGEEHTDGGYEYS